MYHLNPASAGALPVNMDTGDVFGDLYFYLGEFLLPLECAGQSEEGRAHFDCDNPERVDPDRVVTRVGLEVDMRMWTHYSGCNLCNGTDPFTNKSCVVGTYVCDCFNQYYPARCNPKGVGKENITEHFVPHRPTSECSSALQATCGQYSHDSSRCPACIESHKSQLANATCWEVDLFRFCPSKWDVCSASGPEWACWAANIPRKTGGFWYSTLQEGQCKNTSEPGGCSWKALSLKTVRASCLSDVLASSVESHDESGCFQGCGPRNKTSPCWIGCFFDTLLGEGARHSEHDELKGMDRTDIEKSWNSAFLPKEEGGCEEVQIPNSWIPPLFDLIV